MRLTVLILLLPVAVFFGWILLQPRLGEAGDSLIPIWFVIWMFTTLICFTWGFFIFRRYRRLAWCCFAVAFLQIILAILPMIGTRNVRHHTPPAQSEWSNKSLQATAMRHSVLTVIENVIIIIP